MHCITSIPFESAGLSIDIPKLPRQADWSCLYTRRQYVDKSLVGIFFSLLLHTIIKSSL